MTNAELDQLLIEEKKRAQIRYDAREFDRAACHLLGGIFTVLVELTKRTIELKIK